MIEYSGNTAIRKLNTYLKNDETILKDIEILKIIEVYENMQNIPSKTICTCKKDNQITEIEIKNLITSDCDIKTAKDMDELIKDKVPGAEMFAEIKQFFTTTLENEEITKVSQKENLEDMKKIILDTIKQSPAKEYYTENLKGKDLIDKDAIDYIPEEMKNDLNFLMDLARIEPDIKMHFKFREFRDFCRIIEETSRKPKNFLITYYHNKYIVENLKIGEEVKFIIKDNKGLVARLDGTIIGGCTRYTYTHIYESLINYQINGSIILKSKISEKKATGEIKVDTKIYFADNSFNIQGIEKIELKLKNENNQNNTDFEEINPLQENIISSYNDSIQDIACTNIGDRVITNENLELEQEVYCKRDYNNPYDPNAVEVFSLNGQSIGYLYRFCAQDIAYFIDHKFGTVTGKIVKYESRKARGSRCKKALISVQLKLEKNG